MLNLLFKTLYTQYRICFFSGSPVALPYSNGVLILLTALVVVVRSLFLTTIPNVSFVESLGFTALYFIIFGVGIYLLLGMQRKMNRWHKIFSALVGTKVILLLVFLPFIILINAPAAWMLLIFAQDIWILAVGGYVLHKGMEIRLFSGIFLFILLDIIANIPASLQLSSQLKMITE